MNKIILPVILILIAIGIFLTYTKGQYAKVQSLRDTNTEYQKAIDNSVALISKRDQVVNAYNSISEADRARLASILPGHTDSVRLIVDIRSIIERRGGILKNVNTGESKIGVGKAAPVKTNTSAQAVSDTPQGDQDDGGVQATLVTFDFVSTYDSFLQILKDMESSLRLIEITKITFSVGETNQYNFTVQIKAFSLKEK